MQRKTQRRMQRKTGGGRKRAWRIGRRREGNGRSDHPGWCCVSIRFVHYTLLCSWLEVVYQRGIWCCITLLIARLNQWALFCRFMCACVNQPSVLNWNGAEGDGATAIMAQYETARRFSLPGLNFEHATGVVSPFNSTFGGSPTHADLKLKMGRPFEISNQPSLFAASTISSANNGPNGYNAHSPFSFSGMHPHRVFSGNGNAQRPATVAGDRGRLKTPAPLQLQLQAQQQLQLQGQQQQRPGTSVPPGGPNRRLTFG